MRYSAWNKLSDEQKKNAHWKHHPRIRVATIFTILFALVFGVALLRVFKNKRVHVNRKPNRLEAFSTAKLLIKNKLKRPATFPGNTFDADIDTAQSAYHITSYVNTQDSTGKFVKINWQINMNYTGGDWADTKSWQVAGIEFKP